MSRPSKNEQKRIDALYKQLQKMDESVKSKLNVYLVVNDRDPIVLWTMNDVLEHIQIAAEKLKSITSEGLINAGGCNQKAER